MINSVKMAPVYIKQHNNSNFTHENVTKIVYVYTNLCKKCALLHISELISSGRTMQPETLVAGKTKRILGHRYSNNVRRAQKS